MAYLKSTNINGDLSVTGGITVSDSGLIRESSGTDFYLGRPNILPSGADLNNYITPGQMYASGEVTTTLVNCPVPDNYVTRLINIQLSVSTLMQIILSTDGNIYKRNVSGVTSSTPSFGSWQTISYENDTGWNYVTLNSVVVPYDANEGYTPRYRKIGNLVQVKGTLSPSSNSNSFGSSGGAAVFTMPAGYRPSVIPITSLFQGTAKSFFAMSINTAGVATISRYRNENGYETPITTSWMPFHFEYFADQ